MDIVRAYVKYCLKTLGLHHGYNRRKFRRSNIVCIKSLLLDVCWQMSCYIFNRVYSFCHRSGKCYIFGFPILLLSTHTHDAC